jgi:hypothetical protein
MNGRAALAQAPGLPPSMPPLREGRPLRSTSTGVGVETPSPIVPNRAASSRREAESVLVSPGSGDPHHRVLALID